VRAETAIRVCAKQCNAQRLLIQLHDYVRLRSQELSVEGLENVRFTRREIRERLKVGQTQLAAHLSRLVQYEYVQTYPINGRKLHYQLNWDGRGREGELILGGLVDPKALSEPAPINHATVGPRASVIGLKASIIAPLSGYYRATLNVAKRYL